MRWKDERSVEIIYNYRIQMSEYKLIPDCEYTKKKKKQSRKH